MPEFCWADSRQTYIVKSGRAALKKLMNKTRDGKENKDMAQYCSVTFKQLKAYMIQKI